MLPEDLLNAGMASTYLNNNSSSNNHIRVVTTMTTDGKIVKKRRCQRKYRLGYTLNAMGHLNLIRDGGDGNNINDANDLGDANDGDDAVRANRSNDSNGSTSAGGNIDSIFESYSGSMMGVGRGSMAPVALRDDTMNAPNDINEVHGSPDTNESGESNTSSSSDERTNKRKSGRSRYTTEIHPLHPSIACLFLGDDMFFGERRADRIPQVDEEDDV